MKKFILKLIFFFTLVLVVSLSINYLYLCKKPVENSKFSYVPDKIEVCNFGSSHGRYGYNYEDYTDDFVCFNFALVSQSLSYDYRILQHYKDKISAGSIVIVTVSYSSPFGLIRESDKESFKEKNQRYYKFLYPYEIKKYNLKTDMLIGRFCSMKGDPTEVIDTIFSKNWYRNGNDNYAPNLWMNTDEIKDEVWLKIADASKVKDDAEAAYLRHLVTNKQDEDGKMVYDAEEVEALYKIIDICREIDVNPVLITTPYLKEYTDCIEQGSPDFYDEFYTWINNFSDKEGVPYFDYSHDERFHTNYQLFINSDHLNKEGAKIFTSCIWNEVFPLLNSSLEQ